MNKIGDDLAWNYPDGVRTALGEKKGASLSKYSPPGQGILCCIVSYPFMYFIF